MILILLLHILFDVPFVQSPVITIPWDTHCIWETSHHTCEDVTYEVVVVVAVVVDDDNDEIIIANGDAHRNKEAEMCRNERFHIPPIMIYILYSFVDDPLIS